MVTRQQKWLIKQFSDNQSDGGDLLLRWEALQQSQYLEQRLSQLCQWIILAHQMQRPYGLQLPQKIIKPTQGQVHYHRCLIALADFY